MKIINELIRYQYRQYMLSARYLMPLIALLAIISVMYTFSPVKIVNSFSMMSLFLFLIMVWVGVANQEIEPEVSEQIIILRIQSERKYYISHILFMGIISTVVTVISIGIPVLSHIIHRENVFGRKVIGSDIIGAFFLMFATAFSGAMVGELFHPRIVKDKRIGLGATFLMALLAVVRISVIDKFPVSKCVLWLIPPVSDVVSWFSNEEYFNMGKVIYAFGLMMVYGIILAIIKMELLRIRRY